MIQITENPQNRLVAPLNEIAYDWLNLKYYRQTTSPSGNRWVEISVTEALGLTDGTFGDATHAPVIVVSNGTVSNITQVAISGLGVNIATNDLTMTGVGITRTFDFNNSDLNFTNGTSFNVVMGDETWVGAASQVFVDDINSGLYSQDGAGKFAEINAHAHGHVHLNASDEIELDIGGVEWMKINPTDGFSIELYDRNNNVGMVVDSINDILYLGDVFVATSYISIDTVNNEIILVAPNNVKIQDGSEGTIGHVFTSTAVDGTGAWAALPAGFITAISDTNTIDLTVAVTTLSADVRHQDTATINLSDDAGGLKADFASMNISQFTNDSVYLDQTAADLLYQPLDADLTSIAGLGFVSTSFLKKTALNTWALDTNVYMTNPMTTLGDIVYENAVPTPDRLAGNTTTTKKFLSQTGTGVISAAPVWDDVAVSNITGLGTGVATALAVNVGSAGAFVTFNGALGTPSSGTLTNATGLPISTGVSGLGANVATFLATPSSANLASAVTDETGAGLLVFNNSPTFVDDITIGTVATSTGSVKLLGTTSGTVTLSVADAAGTWTMKLPVDDGTPNQFLQTDGSGNCTWATGSATVGDADYGDVTVSGAGTIWTVDSFTTSNEAVDTTNFVVFVNSAASANQIARTNTNFTFDASINRLGATTFIGTAFLTSSASPATTGTFRLANTGAIRWRNAANLNNYGITLTAADVIEFEAGIAGVNIASGNLTMLTSASITTGTIELGNATDTTLARSGAGVVTIEGAEIITGNPVSVAKGGTGQTTEAEAIGELIQALTQDMLPDPTADFFATYDASADTGKKIQMNQYAPKGHIFGLIMSNDAGDTTNDISIAVGEAVDETGAINMVLSSAIIKQIDAAWAVGTNQGGMNTGAVANSTWYEVHLIRRSDTGVVDVMFTTTANRATLPTNYDTQRRIGWVRRGTGTNLQFTQVNDYFTLTTPVNDVDATATASATSRTLTVPPSCIARFRAATLGNTSVNAANGIVFSELVETDTAPTTGNGFNSIGAGDFAIIGAGHIELRVNSSSQIRDRAITATGSMAYDISTFGWIDGRLRLSSTN